MSGPNARTTTIAGVAVGAVALAALAGTSVALSRHGDLALPDRLAGKVASDTQSAFPTDVDEEQRDLTIARVKASNDYSDQQMEKLYDAEVVSRYYVSPNRGNGSEFGVTLIGKEVDLPAPDGFGDPELLGMAAPMDEVVARGSVQCLLRRVNPPRDGADFAEEDLAPDRITCQRVGSGLTVRVVVFSDAEIDEAVEITNEFFGVVS